MDKELFEKLTELCDALKNIDAEELSYIIIANYDGQGLGSIHGNDQAIFWMIADMIFKTAAHMEQSPKYIVACVLDILLYIMNQEEGENELE